MAIYGEMPNGWRLHNVSMGGEPAWIKTFEVEIPTMVANRNGKALPGPLVPQVRGVKPIKRRVILGMNPFSGKWFWQTTDTQTDDGKGDGMEYDDPVACAVVCEMTFGSTKTYEPLARNGGWGPGTV